MNPEREQQTESRKPGEMKIVTTFPIADGTNLGWTPSDGTDHFANVDNPNPATETTYNFSDTAGAIDTFRFADPVATTISAVLVTATMRRDDVGPHSAAIEYRSISGTEYTAATQFPLSNYLTFGQLYETNPETGVAWVPADLVGAEFGVKLIS